MLRVLMQMALIPQLIVVLFSKSRQFAPEDQSISIHLLLWLGFQIQRIFSDVKPFISWLHIKILQKFD